MTARPAPEDGFTLIEAMVALAILGIAAVGIIRAAEGHIDTLYGLERRAAAQWVAENALAAASLGVPGDRSGTGDSTMLDWRWKTRITLTSSDDPDLQMASVQVSDAQSDKPLVTLRGFVDRGTITP